MGCHEGYENLHGSDMTDISKWPSYSLSINSELSCSFCPSSLGQLLVNIRKKSYREPGGLDEVKIYDRNNVEDVFLLCLHEQISGKFFEITGFPKEILQFFLNK